MEWYKKAADLGDTYAMRYIGNIYRNDAVGIDYYDKGIIFSQNISDGCHKALEWFKRAADLGDTEAMNDIASLYQDDAEYNYGVFTDGYRKALEWYRKLIETSSDTTDYYFKKAQEQIPKLEEILRKNNG